MIVRIMGEGQYRLSDDAIQRVNDLDNACVDAVDRCEEGVFRSRFEQMLTLIREEGDELPDDDLEGSDVIVPPPDTSFEEASREFTGDGLIPD